MSEQNQNRNNRSGGNNGNRNRNRNRSGGQGGGQGGNRNRNQQNNRGGKGSGGASASDKRNELQPSRGRRPRKKPLTFWQKCLKAVGLYKDPTPPAKGGQGGQKGAPKKQAAKKSGRVAGGGRVERGQGQGQGQRNGQKSRQRKKTPPPTKVETPRLYVGNLSYDATEYDLEELFKGVGAVRKVELVYNRHTHKSKGYGFVNMANMEEAERAVEVLHDQPFMGRKMIVNGARSKGPNDSSKNAEASDNGADEPKQEDAPATPAPAPAADVPAEEEVHSLAPDKQ